MTRKNFFQLGLAVIVGASIWLYFSYKGIKTTQDALVEQAELTRARRPASIPVVVSPPPENRAVTATKARLQQEAPTADTFSSELQSNQAQVARNQIDENIRSQENYIRQTQDEIIYWQQNTNDLTARQARLDELNNLQLQQQQQLELMQNEKLLLSSQALQGPQSVQQAREQALSDLNQDRSSLQEEIAIRRSQIQSLQENIYETTTNDFSLRRPAV